MNFKKILCAALACIIIVIPLNACASNNSSSANTGAAKSNQWRQGGAQGNRSENQLGNSASSGSDSANVILGRVTSIVGNEVTLELVKESGESGSASGNSSNSSSSANSSSDSSSSDGYTSTGETKTLLIPVGLTLSTGGQGNSGSGGNALGGGAPTGGAPAGEPPTGGAPTGGAPTNTQNTGGTSSNSSAKSGTSNRTGTSSKSGASTKSATSSTTTKSGFSSITADEILRITQKTVNGALTVVRVSVVSKS